MINRDLCRAVQQPPSGANIRRWTLNNTLGQHNGVVNISESPLYFELSWRETAKDPKQRVGLFYLNLPGLLQGGFIRHEPKDSLGPKVRLRIIRTNDGKFYIQVNQDGPCIQLV